MTSAMSAEDRLLLTGLNAEWRRLGDSEDDRLAAWASRWSCLVGLSSLAETIVAGRHRDDAILAALLAESHAGDPVAGRVVLQAVLPAMVRMAGRDPVASLSDYVGQVWCRIRTYPLERRPRRIANNLELDTLKAVQRGRTSVTVPVPPEHWDELRLERAAAMNAAEPDGLTIIRIAERYGLIDDHTALVLRSVYAEGLTGREAADRLGCSVDLVRWRCSRGVRTLARHASLLADAA